MNKQSQKVVTVLAWSLFFTVLLFLLMSVGGASVAANGVLVPLVTPTVLPEEEEKEDVFRKTKVVIAPDGVVDVRDIPCGTKRFTVPAGTLVRTLSRATACGSTWYLVENLDGVGSGWVPASTLLDPGTQGPTFGNCRFATGNAAGPGAFSAAPLPIMAEALWMRCDFSGLHWGDKVQQVLVVGNERYASPPAEWRGVATGQLWSNLLLHQPRKGAGQWVVWFFVNDEFVGQGSVTVR